MSHGLLPYEVDVGLRADTLPGRAGLPLVVETLRALGLERVIEAEVRVRQRASGYTEAEKVEALVLLLAAGGDCVDDMAVLQADAGLGRLLGGPLPSADTLRQFLYAFHDPTLIEAAQAQRAPTEVAYIPAENAALQPLPCRTGVTESEAVDFESMAMFHEVSLVFTAFPPEISAQLEVANTVMRALSRLETSSEPPPHWRKSESWDISRNCFSVVLTLAV